MRYSIGPLLFILLLSNPAGAAPTQSTCPESEDLTSQIGLRASNLSDPPNSTFQTSAYGFEPSEDAVTFEDFAAAPIAGDTGDPTGVKRFQDPRVITLLGENGVANTINDDLSIAVGRAHDGNGYIQVWADGPNLTSQMLWLGMPGFKRVHFYAMLGYVLGSDNRALDSLVTARFRIKQNGVDRVNIDLKPSIVQAGCRDGGNFRLLNGSIPSDQPFLRECNYAEFTLDVDPSTFTADPLIAIWDLRTTAGFTYPTIRPVAFLSVDSLTFDFPSTELTCSGTLRSTEVGTCQLPVPNPAYFVRVTDDQGHQTLLNSGQMPQMQAGWTRAVNHPGLYQIDGVCQAQRQFNLGLRTCGRSRQMGVYWLEPQRPKPVIARLTSEAAIVFPPPTGCYTQNATAYEIQDTNRQPIATVPADTLDRDGYVLHGLPANIGRSVVMKPIYGSTPGMVTFSDSTYWAPTVPEITLNHMPTYANPANIKITVPRVTTDGTVISNVAVMPADSPTEGPARLSFHQLSSNAATGSSGPSLSVRLSTTEPPLGHVPLQSFWVLTGEIERRLNDRQRAAALKYFGDPAQLARDHERCFFDDPALSQLQPNPNPAMNLCDCAFEGMDFRCRPQVESAVHLLTIPAPTRLLDRALIHFYENIVFATERAPNIHIGDLIDIRGLLRNSNWVGWMKRTQQGASPLFPAASFDLNVLNDPSRLTSIAQTMATYDLLRMIAWDQKPGNNLFKGNSSLLNDWIPAFTILFYQRAIRPIGELPRSDLFSSGFVDADSDAVRLLMAFIDVQSELEGRVSTVAEFKELDQMLTELEAERSRLFHQDPLWDLHGMGFTTWPGEISLDSCPLSGCSPSQQSLLPKCEPSDRNAYVKKFRGYEFNGRSVTGYFRMVDLSSHVRPGAVHTVTQILDRAAQDNRITFSDQGRPGDDEVTDGEEYSTVTPILSTLLSSTPRAWQTRGSVVPEPSIADLERRTTIAMNQWYCRGKKDDGGDILYHEAAHIAHDIADLYSPAAQQAFAAIRKQSDAKLAYAYHGMWSEYRAYRFEYCTKAGDFLPVRGACADERRLFAAIFFGTPLPHGIRAPKGLYGPRPYYLKRWARERLCGSSRQCRDIRDVIVPLPIGDICSTVLHTTGTCPDLP